MIWKGKRSGPNFTHFPLTKKGIEKELKGSKLLDKDRFKWAAQEDALPASTRRVLASRFLSNFSGSPRRDEFTAYGQACLHFARRLFETLETYRAYIFAVAIPRKTPKPPLHLPSDYLRRDYIYLLERYAYFLEERDTQGLLIMDRSDDGVDGPLTRSVMKYFMHTTKGRKRARQILPYPFFVSSGITSPVQIADVVIYCINWGYRIRDRGMTLDTRTEIEDGFSESIRRLLWQGTGGGSEGRKFATYSIQYIVDVYGEGR